MHSEFRIHSELMIEQVRAVARDAETGREESGGRWTPGLRAGVRAVWPTGRPVALIVGIDGWTLTGATTIRAADERIGSSSSAGLSILLGGELYLP
jgi:hypothetical protein